MALFLSVLMVAMLVWMVYCERRQEKEIEHQIPRYSRGRAFITSSLVELDRLNRMDKIVEMIEENRKVWFT